MERADIPFNSRCKTGELPRHLRKVERLEDTLDSFGVEPVLHPFDFKGDNNLQVIDHTHEQIDRILYGSPNPNKLRFVPSFGDGGVSVFINALISSLKGKELEQALIIFDGGTMSNLANSLNTADPVIVAKIIKGLIRYKIKRLRIREADITIFDDESRQHVHAQKSLPWVNSAGLEFAGDVISKWENHSRKHHPIINLARSVRETVRDTVQRHKQSNNNGKKKNGNVKGISISTLPKLGCFTLPIDESVMESDQFVTQTFESPLGKEALKRIGLYLAVGASPKLSTLLWRKMPDDPKDRLFSDFWRLIGEIKPIQDDNQEFIVDSDSPNMHLDGTPVKLDEMGLTGDKIAQIVFRSTERSIPVVQALE